MVESPKTLTEILPVLHELPHADKLRAVQYLVFELVREEGVANLNAGGTYPIWSPLNAFEAADTMLKALAEEKRPYG